MAKTIVTDGIVAEILTDAVQGEFAGKGAFMGSPLMNLGIVNVNGSFTGNANEIGSTVKVPYFGVIGDFTQNLTDGDAATAVKLSQTSETATVVRDSLAFEVSRWAQNAAGGIDPYAEAARQIMLAATRNMDKRIIAACLSATDLVVKNVYSASVPRKLDYDTMADALTLFGDDAEGVAAIAVNSKVLADLYKMKDGVGRPLLSDMVNGGLPKFMGYPVIVSDMLPVGATHTAVTSSGTSPPVITIDGSSAPIAAFDIKLDCTLDGARGTWTFKFSTDGGNTWSANLTSAATVTLTDTAVDSKVGHNGRTGIIIAIAAGSATASDNEWSFSAGTTAQSLILKKDSCAFWYNKSALTLLTDKDVLSDTSVAAMHMYSASLRYRRHRGGTKSGVVCVKHNWGG
jgi:hypothetical protein